MFPFKKSSADIWLSPIPLPGMVSDTYTISQTITPARKLLLAILPSSVFPRYSRLSTTIHPLPSHRSRPVRCRFGFSFQFGTGVHGTSLRCNCTVWLFRQFPLCCFKKIPHWTVLLSTFFDLNLYFPFFALPTLTEKHKEVSLFVSSQKTSCNNTWQEGQLTVLPVLLKTTRLVHG